MLKTLLISTAVSTLMVSGAFAQANPPAHPPAAATTSPAASPKFVAKQSANQWAFSKFKGTDVLGPNNAHIGDVEDVLFDKNGKVEAVVVGVGGFLGIGEKNVALDMSAFQIVPASSNSNTASNDPNDIKLKVSWTKDQLKSAPAFEYYKAQANTSPTTGMAPRPATPPAPMQR
jgi:sporulation protein YlmC with PRC-barrel domain